VKRFCVVRAKMDVCGGLLRLAVEQLWGYDSVERASRGAAHNRRIRKEPLATPLGLIILSVILLRAVRDSLRRSARSLHAGGLSRLVVVVVVVCVCGEDDNDDNTLTDSLPSSCLPACLSPIGHGVSGSSGCRSCLHTHTHTHTPTPTREASPRRHTQATPCAHHYPDQYNHTHAPPWP
jgi:hypothetical protein